MQERRRETRREVFGKVDVKRKAPSGEVEVLPVYVRDVSPGGMRGILFVDRPPSGQEALFLDGPSGVRQVRVAWCQRLGEAAHILGLELGPTTPMAS
jgi:hypothetical protein